MFVHPHKIPIMAMNASPRAPTNLLKNVSDAMRSLLLSDVRSPSALRVFDVDNVETKVSTLLQTISNMFGGIMWNGNTVEVVLAYGCDLLAAEYATQSVSTKHTKRSFQNPLTVTPHFMPEIGCVQIRMCYHIFHTKTGLLRNTSVVLDVGNGVLSRCFDVVLIKYAQDFKELVRVYCNPSSSLLMLTQCDKLFRRIATQEPEVGWTRPPKCDGSNRKLWMFNTNNAYALVAQSAQAGEMITFNLGFDMGEVNFSTICKEVHPATNNQQEDFQQNFVRMCEWLRSKLDGGCTFAHTEYESMTGDTWGSVSHQDAIWPHDRSITAATTSVDQADLPRAHDLLSLYPIDSDEYSVLYYLMCTTGDTTAQPTPEEEEKKSGDSKNNNTWTSKKRPKAKNHFGTTAWKDALAYVRQQVSGDTTATKSRIFNTTKTIQSNGKILSVSMTTDPKIEPVYHITQRVTFVGDDALGHLDESKVETTTKPMETPLTLSGELRVVNYSSGMPGFSLEITSQHHPTIPKMNARIGTHPKLIQKLNQLKKEQDNANLTKTMLHNATFPRGALGVFVAVAASKLPKKNKAIVLKMKVGRSSLLVVDPETLITIALNTLLAEPRIVGTALHILLGAEKRSKSFRLNFSHFLPAVVLPDYLRFAPNISPAVKRKGAAEIKNWCRGETRERYATLCEIICASEVVSDREEEKQKARQTCDDDSAEVAHFEVTLGPADLKKSSSTSTLENIENSALGADAEITFDLGDVVNSEAVSQIAYYRLLMIVTMVDENTNERKLDEAMCNIGLPRPGKVLSKLMRSKSKFAVMLVLLRLQVKMDTLLNPTLITEGNLLKYGLLRVSKLKTWRWKWLNDATSKRGHGLLSSWALWMKLHTLAQSQETFGTPLVATFEAAFPHIGDGSPNEQTTAFITAAQQQLVSYRPPGANQDIQTCLISELPGSLRGVCFLDMDGTRKPNPCLDEGHAHIIQEVANYSPDGYCMLSANPEVLESTWAVEIGAVCVGAHLAGTPQTMFVHYCNARKTAVIAHFQASHVDDDVQVGNMSNAVKRSEGDSTMSQKHSNRSSSSVYIVNPREETNPAELIYFLVGASLNRAKHSEDSLIVNHAVTHAQQILQGAHHLFSTAACHHQHPNPVIDIELVAEIEDGIRACEQNVFHSALVAKHDTGKTTFNTWLALHLTSAFPDHLVFYFPADALALSSKFSTSWLIELLGLSKSTIPCIALTECTALSGTRLPEGMMVFSGARIMSRCFILKRTRPLKTIAENLDESWCSPESFVEFKDEVPAFKSMFDVNRLVELSGMMQRASRPIMEFLAARVVNVAVGDDLQPNEIYAELIHTKRVVFWNWLLRHMQFAGYFLDDESQEKYEVAVSNL
jgi:hypothetical protein